MQKVISNTIIVGLKTTIPFCSKIFQHPDFINGTYTTRWIEDNYKSEMLFDQNEEIVGALTASIIYALDYLKVASNTPDYTNDSLSLWVLNKRINK